MHGLEQLIEQTLKQYEKNTKIRKRKGDRDRIMACQTMKELLEMRRKLGLVEWES